MRRSVSQVSDTGTVPTFLEVHRCRDRPHARALWKSQRPPLSLRSAEPAWPACGRAEARQAPRESSHHCVPLLGSTRVLPCFSGPDGGRRPPSSMGCRVPNPVTPSPSSGGGSLDQTPKRRPGRALWEVSSRGPERRVLGGPPALSRHTTTGEPARATGLPSGPCPRRREGCCLSLTAAAKQPHPHDGPREKPHNSKTPALPKDDGPCRAHAPCPDVGRRQRQPTHTPSLQTLLLAWHVQALSPPSPGYSIPNQPKPDQHQVKRPWNKTNRAQTISAYGLQPRAQKPVRGRQAPGTTWSLGPPSALALRSLWAGLPLQLLSLLTKTRLPACASTRGPAAHRASAFWEDAGSRHVPVPVRTHCSPLVGSGPQEEAATLAGGSSAGNARPTAGSSPHRPLLPPAGGCRLRPFLALLTVPGGPRLSGNQGHGGLAPGHTPLAQTDLVKLLLQGPVLRHNGDLGLQVPVD